MFSAMIDYLTRLGERLGRGWNRFWFTPTDPFLICLLRIGCGTAAVIYLLSHTWDLVTWFGPGGLLPNETMRQLAGETQVARGMSWSYLHYIDHPSLLWATHVLAIVVAAAFAVGLFARLSGILTLVVVLSYIHRAPMLSGAWEPILSMTLLYLCIAPCGARWSLDSWRRKAAVEGSPPTGDSVAANVAIRLMQVHLAGFYFMMGATKLAGDTWWLGEAVWWLIAHTESRLLDMTSLRSAFLLVNLWSHLIVLFELSFAVLIWIPVTRPLLFGIAIVMWGALALLTGQLAFCGMMVIANSCFLEADHFRVLPRRRGYAN